MHGEISGNRKNKRITVLSAYSNTTKKLVAPIYFTGNTDTSLFNWWLEEILLPQLLPSQIIVMDNASFHKSAKTKELIKSANCLLLYLPPYSPDLNPIEQKWGSIKKIAKRIRNDFNNFHDCLDYLLCYQ